MAVPKYHEFHKPILMFLNDGNTHSLKEVKTYLADIYRLSEQELAQRVPSGKQNLFSNRVGWAITYLKKAGLLTSPSRTLFVITEEGKRVIVSSPPIIDVEYLKKYDSFREFQSRSSAPKKKSLEEKKQSEETPDDMLDDAFKQINNNLAEEVLSEVMKLSPAVFEQMVLDLLSKMGYGTFENSSTATVISGDEGIDGVIMEDKLGFGLIYVQAKRWNEDRCVGRPEIQAFVGAIAGKGRKGLMVTTSKFTKQAVEYAKTQHIILMDGKKLADFMIENNFGVSTKKTYEIKAIDSDLFNDYQDN